MRWGQPPQANLLVNSVPLMADHVSAAPGGPVSTATVLAPNTPLAQLIPPVDQPQPTPSAIIVSRNLPPVPFQLATKIWEGKYVELDGLLPSRLGAPEPTLGDLVAGEKQHKGKRVIGCIQEWVTCFNTYMSVLAYQNPDRLVDLLAYSSLIVKASVDFEGDSWLTYDKFFRKQAAAEPARYPTWGAVEPSMWTQHFGRAVATPICKECGDSGHKSCLKNKRGESTEQAKANTNNNRYKPYTRRAPVCRRWNGGGRCSTTYCNFQHVCSYCYKEHRVQECPQLKGKEKEGSSKEESSRKHF